MIEQKISIRISKSVQFEIHYFYIGVFKLIKLSVNFVVNKKKPWAVYFDPIESVFI